MESVKVDTSRHRKSKYTEGIVKIYRNKDLEIMDENNKTKIEPV
jgi:hypothetical protein